MSVNSCCCSIGSVFAIEIENVSLVLCLYNTFSISIFLQSKSRTCHAHCPISYINKLCLLLHVTLRTPFFYAHKSLFNNCHYNVGKQPHLIESYRDIVDYHHQLPRQVKTHKSVHLYYVPMRHNRFE